MGELAQLVVSHLRHQGAEGAIFLAVTEQQDTARELLSAIEDELDGIELVVSARADGLRYWSDEPGFPDEGVAYETSGHHLSIVQAIAAGQEILPDRQALVDRFRAVDGERRRWLEHGAETVLSQIVPILSRTGEAEIGRVGMQHVQPILDRGLAGEPLNDDDMTRLSIWVSCAAVRDEVWDQITRDNSEAMLRLLTVVSRSATVPFEPAVLSLAAFASWLGGDGAQALIAAERALCADPSYSMAVLMLQMLEVGVPPSSWKGISAEEPASP